mmetsp:Transcript_10155/g.30153  ORF Transcript_10155/g.30153 Transcript_10155/m.30153 type:complete len:202 (-) Transcript_10155:1071-1676(-)
MRHHGPSRCARRARGPHRRLHPGRQGRGSAPVLLLRLRRLRAAPRRARPPHHPAGRRGRGAARVVQHPEGAQAVHARRSNEGPGVPADLPGPGGARGAERRVAGAQSQRPGGVDLDVGPVAPAPRRRRRRRGRGEGQHGSALVSARRGVLDPRLLWGASQVLLARACVLLFAALLQQQHLFPAFSRLFCREDGRLLLFDCK